MKNRAIGNIVLQSEARNTYRVRVSWRADPSTSKRRQFSETVTGHKRAEKRLAELIDQIEKNTFVEAGRLTVGEYLDQWLRDYCWPNLTPRSAESYAYIVSHHIAPALGRMLLTQLRPEHLQHLYSDKQVALSPRTVQYIHATLHKALGTAVKMGKLAINPADRVDPPKQKRHELMVWDESEVNRFLEHAKTTEYYPFCYLALFTGMRRSELLALKWGDVDLLLCRLSVRRTLHQLHNGKVVYGEPKTERSKRLITLTPSTAMVLRDHREYQDSLRVALGQPAQTDDNLVFCHYDGSPWLPDSLTHTWARLAKEAGVKHISLHAARHTHASLMLKQGTHVKVVSERLGHANITTTLNTYSHVLPGIQEAAALRFDDMVAPKVTQ